jgi:spermidine/putrescine transport system permease protein
MKKKPTIVLSALAALLLSGCGKAPETQSPTSSEPPPGSSPGIAESLPKTKNLNIYCWSEYIPQAVIDDFAKESGITVAVENYASNEEMLAKLGAGGGNYDIIQPSEYVTEALVKSALLEPLDKAKIPNLANIAPQFLNLPFDPGNIYSVPFMAGTVGIVVNSEVEKADIKSFADVFKPEHNQKIVVLDDAREIVSWALLSQGIPVNDVSNENLEKAKGVLANWLPLVKVYDSDSPKTALLNGDVTIGVVWGGEGAILLKEDKKFKWVVPSEGTHLFIDSLAIPKGAKNVANAEAFIDFILRPDISARISEEFPYTNPNLAARKLLTPEQLANPASFPTDEEIATMETFRDVGQQASQIDEIVTSLKVQ